MTTETSSGQFHPGSGNRPDYDKTLCECDLEPLQRLVEQIEQQSTVQILKRPSVCLTMIPAEDSLERQKFYLGEALTTDCEVLVDGIPGYGLCLGDEAQRCYCIAVLDAQLNTGSEIPSWVEAFLKEQSAVVAHHEQDEYNLILQTQVDFKLMEEA
jgi:phosphonate C-P lyase system protein PhnG